MVVTDPKGGQGYRTASLGFRSFAGDGYNLLEYAVDIYACRVDGVLLR